MEFQFSSLSDFFWMAAEGRIHGPYVWGAYAITLGGIVGMALNVRMARRRFFKKQASLIKRQANIASAEQNKAPNESQPTST